VTPTEMTRNRAERKIPVETIAQGATTDAHLMGRTLAKGLNRRMKNKGDDRITKLMLCYIICQGTMLPIK